MKRLKNKYRFVILNDNDFEEKVSFSLKGANFIAFLSILIFVVFVLVFLLFFLTPFKYYIPGYSGHNTEQKVHELAIKVDSLSGALETRETYLENVRKVLKGDVADSGNVYQKNERIQDSVLPNNNSSELKDMVAADSIEADFSTNTRFQNAPEVNSGQNSSLQEKSFFPPLKGVITESFNKGADHFAIDVVGPENIGIKAVKDGYVVFSGWSASTGNVIILQHQNNLLSVYKHNSQLLKKSGNFVKAGEPIAIIGTSGHLSTGPHLHFELWHNGKPVNPEEYIKF